MTIRKTLALRIPRVCAAAVVLGATGLALPLASTSAEAMPGLGAAVMHNDAGARIDKVRWVCGPYRCHWAPNYYGYGYGPGWGYRGGWGGRRWRRW